MTTVAYITRDPAGTTRHGNFSEGTPARLNAAPFKDISLNLVAADVESYARHGGDLHITLANGQTLILENYFTGGAGGSKNLFLSADNAMVEVVLEDKAGGMLFAGYEPLDLTGKWSSYDDMMFLGVDRIEPVVAPLAAAGFGGLGAAGAAAGVGAAALVASGGGGGGDGSTGPAAIVPTVDDPDASYPISGSSTDPVVITGTGEADSEVTVTLGTATATTTVDDDGIWSVSFPVDELPEDGSYETEVQVTAPDGTEYTLDGPEVVIDTTPPEAEITSGAVSTGDIVNGEEQAEGTVITGTGEAGATVTLEIEGTARSTTVAEDGTWTLTFTPEEIPTGEYDTAISITTTDSFGNSATTGDMLRVDTVAPPVARGTVEGDDIINASEASDGVTLTGTSEAGASITVEFQGLTRSVTADEAGNWSADFAASEIAAGEYDAPVTITATDAAGNSETITSTLRVDTSLAAAYGDGQAGGDDTVNAAEDAAGITLTGTADPDATVVVELGGVSRTAAVDADGNWSASFADGDIPAGTYDAEVVVTVTDAAGNSEQIVETLAVDTELAPLTAEAEQTADDVVNRAEHAAGITLTGTVETGSAVSVTIEGVTRAATVDADGNWSATFEAADLPEGTYDTSATVTATDAAGNSRSLTESFSVDTELNVSYDADQAGGDGTVNAAEDAAGITLTGTVDPGATVVVGLGSVSRTATVDDTGNWAVSFEDGDIPAGTYNAGVVITATDAAGNSEQIIETLAVDTEVTPLTAEPDQTADDVLNRAEHAAGLTLTGTVEAGSAVEVTIGGVTRDAAVDASGNWSAAFAASDLPEGTYSTSATITATDAAGNSRTLTEAFSVDTEYDTPSVDSVTFSGADVRRIATEGATDNYSVSALEDGGTVSAPSATVDADPVFGTEFTFDAAIPDGTHLVVSRQDAAGNSSSSLVVLDDNASNAGTLDHAGLPQFNIDELNLDYASDVNLTLSEASIQALSGNSDTLTVHGGADDTLTLTGATAAGTRTEDGETYNVYTVGTDGTTLVVDEDVNVVI
ncbi:Ig-like domain-containing protein [Cribrihabitans neustonicus]|uniref:Ig-like domain-containing protein n=1 Tax=Cribrihabitans neustonicus TaxID=1429085 RepID=UPI003B594406